MTRVVNIYHGEPFDVYVGRAGKGQDGYFGNPFKEGSREQKITQFKDYFYERLRNDPEYRYRIHQLRGKTLGCFCVPKICHASVIADYLNSIETLSIKLAVVGSRSFNDFAYMKSILEWYDISQIISGGASGADSLAERYAIEKGIPAKIFPAEWKKHGKKAGYLRNKKIVAHADEIVAFWDKKSPGTRHTINIAEAAGKPASVYWPDSDDFLLKVGTKSGKNKP